MPIREDTSLRGYRRRDLCDPKAVECGARYTESEGDLISVLITLDRDEDIYIKYNSSYNLILF